MAMSSSIYSSGSDEDRAGLVDLCAFCASMGKQQPSVHFCYECGPCGRYICRSCLIHHNLFTDNHDIVRISEVNMAPSKSLKRKLEEASNNNKIYAEIVKKKDKEIEEKQSEIKKMKNELDLKEGEIAEIQTRLDQEILSNRDTQIAYQQAAERANKYEQIVETLHEDTVNCKNQLEEKKKVLSELEEELKNFKEEKYDLEKNCNSLSDVNRHLTKAFQKQNVKIEDLKQKIEVNNLHFSKEIEALKKERDDYRDRLNKVERAKQNADIADLSDPNRAMKLSERFGILYDDEWTNAFEVLTDVEKKFSLPVKKAIELLLNFLKECVKFCETVRESQVESLKNVFLHPVQSSKLAASGGMQNVQKMTDKPRVASKDEKTLRELRRQVGVQPGVILEVKQAFIAEVKTWDKEKGFDKKHIEECIPYLLKCAELCWLIVLPDPPLYMKFDLKQGDKFDSSTYSVYSASGEIYDFLVWPPLLNGEKGGLLSKGVAEPLRRVKKTK